MNRQQKTQRLYGMNDERGAGEPAGQRGGSKSESRKRRNEESREKTSTRRSFHCSGSVIENSGAPRKPKAGKMSWLESLAPLAIIGGMLCVAGNSQNLINKLTTGRPKHPGADAWDKAVEKRDAQLLEECVKAT